MIANNPIGVLVHITNPLEARKACGFSQSEMGRRLGLVHPNGHANRAYTRGAISQWENGIYSMNDDVREAYRRIIVGQVSHHTHGFIVVVSRLGIRKWKFTAKKECDCGRWFSPKRRTDRYCRRCRDATA